MKTLHLLFIALIFLAACSDDNGNKLRITGTGNIVSESRALSSFEDVHISSVIDATITQGSTQEVMISADDNVIQLVRTVVNQGTLRVDLEDGEYDDISIHVTITIPTLSRLTAEGVNNIEVSEFEQLDQLSVNVIGVGNIAMAGSADELSISSSGSANFEGFDFTAGNCDITLSGVGNVQITVDNELTGILSGVGNIMYKGSPTVNVTVSGVGSVIDSN